MGLAESSIIKVINKWGDRKVLTKSLKISRVNSL